MQIYVDWHNNLPFLEQITLITNRLVGRQVHLQLISPQVRPTYVTAHVFSGRNDEKVFAKLYFAYTKHVPIGTNLIRKMMQKCMRKLRYILTYLSTYLPLFIFLGVCKESRVGSTLRYAFILCVAQVHCTHVQTYLPKLNEMRPQDVKRGTKQFQVICREAFKCGTFVIRIYE